MSKYGKKTVYLKAETECLDETDTPVRLPRYTQFHHQKYNLTKQLSLRHF